MTTKIDVRLYVSEMLFHAAVASPWEVAEEEFVALVAMLSNGTKLEPEEREDVTRFFALACEAAARVDLGAADAVSIYRAMCKEARRMGGHVYGDPPKEVF
jgi:hypothetical protein